MLRQNILGYDIIDILYEASLRCSNLVGEGRGGAECQQDYGTRGATINRTRSGQENFWLYKPSR